MKPLPLRQRLRETLAGGAERIALVDVATGRHWRGGELLQALDAASAAIRNAGLGPGDRLGIAAARRPETLVWMLAAIDAGVAYVPFDLAYPPARLAAMAEDAAARAYVGHSEALKALAKAIGGLPGLDAPAPPSPRHGAEADLLYVLYTSGSTGRPKGVAMGAGPLAHLVDWHTDHPRLGQAATTLLFAPFSFDVHFQEIVAGLATGARLVLVDDETRRDPAKLVEVIGTQGIERLYLPYVALQLLADAAEGRALPLRDVISAGEALVLTPAIRRLFENHPTARLHNHYGPTESHVVTAHTLADRPSDWPTVAPIGHALPHVRTFEAHVEGKGTELLLGGDCLAYGYLGRPELETDRFIADRDIGRVYRTGDLVEREADDGYRYLGRIDGQLKIDGFRIEPGEVEAAILGLDGVAEAAVGAIERNGLKSLAAWVVAAPGGRAPDITELRDALSGRLPDAWIPLDLHILDALPKTPSGKLDRAALAGTATATASSATSGLDGRDEQPTDPQAVLLSLWRRALGRPTLGPNESVFDAGARSLLVLRVIAEAKAKGLAGLTVGTIYDHPTVAGQAQGCLTQGEDTPGAWIPRTRDRQEHRDIALIGYAVRAPGCADAHAFEQALEAGHDGISRFRDDELDPAVPDSLRHHPGFVPARGVLEDAESFDAPCFGIPAREAVLLDPQQRLLLELSLTALEHAGVDPERTPGIGVWAGTANNSYAPMMRREAPQLIEQSGEFAAMLGSEKDYAATRIAHRLDLRGPAVSVHTACSTGLVAVGEAVAALRAGRCDVALAGGATVLMPQASGYLHVEGGMESADGQCRPFDASASGTVFSSAGAMVVLKPLDAALADGDRIHAVIKGVGINNDGAGKASFTAPSARGQEAAIRSALADAGLPAASIGFVEAHGTATPLGDPIEVQALASAHGHSARGTPCWLGSLKSNFGHTIAAAGVLGLLKVAFAVREGRIPGTRHFSAANPALGLERTRFRVSAETQAWPASGHPRRGAVSSFGVGGTNAHLILEAPPPRPVSQPERPIRGAILLPLSAASSESTKLRVEAIERFMTLEAPSLQAVQAELVRGRRAQRWRACLLVDETGQTLSPSPAPVEALESPRVVWLFPGQGSQHAGMARAMAAGAPVFAEALEDAFEALRPWRGDMLRRLLLDPPTSDSEALLQDTTYAQPALFAMGLAMARWLAAQGVPCHAALGHSIGEITAACASGALSIHDAARVVCARADAMAACPRGGMAAVRASLDSIAAGLPPTLDVAGINAPSLTVVAGPTDALDVWLAGLGADGIEATRLKVSHAFHSASMEDALSAVEAAFRSASFLTPHVPVYSGRTGRLHESASLADPAGWARQVREPIRFAEAVKGAMSAGETVFVELGPGQALSALVRQARNSTGKAPRTVPLLPAAGRDSDAFRHALGALGTLWSNGVPVDWAVPADATRIPLPTYPFLRTRCMFPRAATSAPVAHPPVADPTTAPTASVPLAPAMSHRLPRLTQQLRALFADIAGVDPEAIDPARPFIEQDFDSLTLTQAALEVGRVFGTAPRLRQLMEDLDHVEALARHLDACLPADPEPATPPPAFIPSTIPSPPPMPAANGDALLALMGQQLALMQQTLAMVASNPPKPEPPAAASPQPASAALLRASPPVRVAASAEPAAPDLKAQPFGASARISTDATSDLAPDQATWLARFTERYLARTGKSRTYSQAHREGMADPRVVTGFNPQWKDLVYPIVADRSDGATVTDIDGNTYIDLLSCFGANLLGYKPKALTEAMHAQLDRGIEVGPQHPLAGEVAGKIARFTGHERVAFCNTGSEAVMGAMRIARTVTGRKTIAIFTNSYHGIFDEVIVRGTRQLRSLAAAPGILANAVENVLVLDYGSEEALRVLRERGRDLAAIMIEPVQNKLPTFQPTDFVRALRGIADEAGCALIFDEVVTGFRLGTGGAQQFYGVRADLCTYGKIIGGGLPLAAIAGRARWMDALDGGTWRFGDDSIPEAGVTYFAGTFVRHPLALAAANATLDVLEARGPALYETLARRTQSLVDRLNAGFAQRNAPVEAVHCASLWRLSWDDGQRFVSLFYYLARFHGLHLYEQFGHFITDAMDDAVIARIGDVFLACLDELMAQGFIRRRDGRDVVPDGAAGTWPRRNDDATQDAPLTPGQRERWLAAQVCDEAGIALNETLRFEIDGALEVEALRRAVGALQARHAAFRTLIDADRPVQRLAGSIAPVPEVIDVSRASDPLAEAELHMARAARTTFPLGRGPMARFALYRLGADRHLLHLVCSHLIIDGWAATVLVDELARLYQAECSGIPATLAPASLPSTFALDLLARMEGEEGERCRTWWQAKLASPPAAVALGDRQPEGRRTYAADTATWRLDGHRFASLKRFARARKLTVFQLVLALVARMVSRRSGKGDVILGVPYAGQALGRYPSLMADGVLELPVRLYIDCKASIETHLADCRAALVDALDHPLMTQGIAARLVGASSQGERPPLTGVYFNLNPRIDTAGFAPLKVDVKEGRKPGLLGELMFNFYDEGGALHLDLHHSTEFFSPQRIQALLEALDEDIKALGDSADASAVTPAPVASSAIAARIEQRFASQVARHPDRIAIRSGSDVLSFAELDARSNRIAQALVARGVRPGDWVGLCLPRSPDLLASLIGILKCGAAYVPLDPSFPLQRLRDMADDAGLRLLLSDAENVERLGLDGLPALRLDADAAVFDAAPATAPEHGVTQDAPAYVIYTSGSTGKPKGVVVLHGGVVNFLDSMAHTPGLAPGERLLAVTTLSFDIAVLELLLPLTVGGEIVLAQRTDAMDGEALKGLIDKHGITLMQATPSTWHLLLEAGFKAPPGFRALCGGEALSPDLARRLLDAGVAALWNMYGPTETTVWSTVERITDSDSITVGRPIDRTVVRILDDAGRECGPGEPGEICIGGAGVAQGYHQRPELTAERFIADPFDAAPGARLYRTGDLGCWTTDGRIRHMGRLDHQVKLRGYRIELGEIEAALERLPSIARAAMRVQNFGPMDDRLVADVVAAPGIEVPRLATLRRELGQRLPDYMLPQVLNVLEAMPLLPNGKIDRKALAGAAPPSAPPATLATAPSVNVTEADRERALMDWIAEAMGTLLQRPALAADEHFFEAGGHSLLAAELAALLRKKLGQRPSLRTLFEAPTPAALASRLGAAMASSEKAPLARPTLARRAHRSTAPLSLQQSRAWFLELTSEDHHGNLLPSAHRLTGPFDPEAFQRALETMVKRQSVLRTVFRPAPEGAEQHILDRIEIDCPMIDASHLPRPQAEAMVRDASLAMQAEPMDLAAGPLFRAAVVKLAADEHVFLFVVHHLVWDGWSFDLLYAEMDRLYPAALERRALPEDPLPIEYGDFCVWQKTAVDTGIFAPQIAHWRERLLPLAPPLALPTDRPRPASMSGRGGSVRFKLEPSIVEGLHGVARGQGTTLFVVLLAAFVELLRSVSGQQDVVVGTPVRGRDEADLLPVMGYFVNALPLRLQREGAGFESVLEEVREVVTEALGFPDTPIEALVRALGLPRDPSRPLLFQTMFSFQDTRGRPRRWGPLEHARFDLPLTGASHDLSLWCVETSKGLDAVFTYATDLFDEARVLEWSRRLEHRLQSLSKASTVDVDFASTPSDAEHQKVGTAMLAPAADRLVFLRSIWRELLQIEDIKPEDNFFELGGHSLLALSMVSRVELASGKRLPLLRVGDSSLAALAALLDQEGASAAPATAGGPTKPDGGLRHWLRRLVGQDAR